MNYNWTPYAVGGATRPDSFSSMTPEMQQGLWGLMQAADAEVGSGLQVYSGYRSPELQASLYDNALKKYGSPEKARKWVAPPGRSKHNSGQAADLKYNGVRIDKLPEEHPVRAWLSDNVSRFGLAQPMSWEPWQVEQAGARGQVLGGVTEPLSYGTHAQPSTGGFMPSTNTQPLSYDGILSAPEPSAPQSIAQSLANIAATSPIFGPEQAPLEVQPMQRAQSLSMTRRDPRAAYLSFFQSI